MRTGYTLTSSGREDRSRTATSNRSTASCETSASTWRSSSRWPMHEGSSSAGTRTITTTDRTRRWTDRTPAEFAAACRGGKDGGPAALENAARFPLSLRTTTALLVQSALGSAWFVSALNVRPAWRHACATIFISRQRRSRSGRGSTGCVTRYSRTVTAEEGRSLSEFLVLLRRPCHGVVMSRLPRDT